MAFPISREEHQLIEARIASLPELIVAAAVCTPFGNITRERPARHGDLWALLPRGWKPDDPDVTHGFMTSHGRFVDRREAARMVVETGQGSPRVHTGYIPALFSEDMWLDLFELSPPAESDAGVRAISEQGNPATDEPIPHPTTSKSAPSGSEPFAPDCPFCSVPLDIEFVDSEMHVAWGTCGKCKERIAVDL